MLKVYYGDEPYGISYLIHKELAEGGYDEECIIKGPLTAEILKDADSGGLFGEKFYILTTPELKGDVIEKLVAHEPASEVRIVADKVDKRTHVFTALTQRKAIKEVTRFGESDLKRFILRCLRGMKITESDFEYLVSKTGYGTVTAVNLYTIEKWCRQICSISPVITREAIDFCIPSECSEDGFKLFSFFIAKDKAGFFKLLLDLLDKGEDEMALLGTLLYQFRIAYKIALVGRKEAQFEVRITPWQINNVPESVSKDEALKNLLLITGAMRNIKFGSSAKNEIITVCSKLF